MQFKAQTSNWIFGAIVIVIIFSVATVLGGQYGRNKAQLSHFLNAIHELDASVEIDARPGCKEVWKAWLSADNVREFFSEAQKVEVGGATGHCQWTHEARIQIRTQNRRMTLFSTVCDQEPGVLVLNGVYDEAYSGEVNEDFAEVSFRISGLGPWILRNAPSGAR